LLFVRFFAVSAMGSLSVRARCVVDAVDYAARRSRAAKAPSKP
jgi:hypothetical protein